MITITRGEQPVFLRLDGLLASVTRSGPPDVLLNSLRRVPGCPPHRAEKDPVTDIVVECLDANGQRLASLTPWRVTPSCGHCEVSRTKQAWKLVFARPAGLDRIEVKVGGRTLHVLDSKIGPSVRIRARPSTRGIRLDVDAAFDFLQIVARNMQTGEWRSLFLRKAPGGTVRQILQVPWDQTPAAEELIIEAHAMKGVRDIVATTKPIRAIPQKPRVGIYETSIRSRPPATGETTASGLEVGLVVKGTLNGVSIPADAFRWKAEGTTCTGSAVCIRTKDRKAVVADVSAHLPGRRIVRLRKTVDPARILKRRSATGRGRTV